MKVLVIGLPKSGTSALAYKIKTGIDNHFKVKSQLIFEPQKKHDWQNIEDYNISKILCLPKQQKFCDAKEVLKIGANFDRKVVIVRDLRDVIISNSLYRWFREHNPRKEHFASAIDLIRKKEQQVSSINLYDISTINIHLGAENLESYAAQIRDNNNQFASIVNCLYQNKWQIFKYEDLVSGSLDDLTKYLGFRISDEVKTTDQNYLRTVRSKTSGNWRNWFTREDVSFFRPLLVESLKILGYDADDWKINEEQIIDPSKSSEYVIKLFGDLSDNAETLKRETLKTYLNQGIQFKKSQKFSLAINTLSQALKINSNYVPVLNQLAEIHENIKDLEKATNYLQQVIKLHPENSIAHAKMGRVMMAKQNTQKAIASYQKAVAINPESPRWIYNQLGTALSENGQIEEAINTYKKAIEIKPNISPAIYKRLGFPLSDTKKRDQVVSAEERIILSNPRPLFSSKHNLALFWSAKSGCTFGSKWFFYQIGLLDAALGYSSWIHHFRQRVFEKFEDYQKNILQMLNPETNIIKLVRNPYSRAVSSYIHAVRHDYEDKRIERFLARPVNEQKRFSFREFIAYLESIDLWHCNAHHKIQMHRSEQMQLIKPNYIIKLENSFERIAKIEESLGLLDSDLNSISQSKHHTTQYKDAHTMNLFADEQFNIYKKTKVSSPPTICFYDNALKEQVAKLYQVDFETYEYDVDIIP